MANYQYATHISVFTLVLSNTKKGNEKSNENMSDTLCFEILDYCFFNLLLKLNELFISKRPTVFII